ncbi:aldehyde dehydrogenase [Nocardioides fonticola]|uniref:Aldehyde dehydrogenase n=1 Tax=Nocardioides fonticola TaxID=450363 RepID=A0ABP7XGD6_9ACTN
MTVTAAVPGHLHVVSAATEEVLATLPEAGPAEVDAAVGAARAAFDDPAGWSTWSAAERGVVLARLAERLAARGDDLVHAVSTQNGMPVAIGAGSEGVVGPRMLGYYASVIAAQPVEEERQRPGGGTTVVRRGPIGVVAVIVPWNFPLSLAFFKLAPALHAGCTIVWKPSPETVLDARIVTEEMAAAGLPDGVVNLVLGGRETGMALVQHPGVDKVAFTGSTAAGRAIGEACGRLLRPVSLELGGKSAAVVLEDADLPAHAADVFAASLLNSGQTCYLSTRVLAPRSRYEEVVEFYAGLARSLRIGDPLDPATQIGPVATAAQRARVEGFIAGALADGSRLVAGGGRPDIDRGWYVEPTVFADVDPRSTLAREEVFGPVLAITPYDDEDHAVALANDSAYGLAGSIWTEDVDRGLAVARRIRTGALGINGFRLDVASPFGGLKDSGLGYELGPEGLATFQELRSIYTALR